jgi:sirohydrochlorin ferrochelatase
MAKDAFDTALAGFGRWAKTARARLAGDQEQDIAEMRVVLDLMRDHLGIAGPAELTPAGLEELLLRVYPRKITILDYAETAGTIPAVSDFLTYLAETGELTRSGAAELDRALTAIAPRFGAAVMDPANWGMARSFVTMMAADGVDLDDEAEFQRWISGYNASAGDPYQEDDGPEPDLKEIFDLPGGLPPIRLPADAELAAAARQVPVISQLISLGMWLGEDGRRVDENGDLPAGDVPAAAAAMSVDTSELPYLWELAMESDLVYLEDDQNDISGEDGEAGLRAVCGDLARDWDDCGDFEVLDAWQTLLGVALLRALEVAAEQEPDQSYGLDLTGYGVGLAVMLFLARARGIPVDEASEVLRETSAAELPAELAAKTWQAWTDEHGDPVRLMLRRLTGLGAVRCTEDPDEGELIWLTPLGLYAVRAQLVISGVDVPLLPEVEDMTAADLLAMSEGAPEEEFSTTTADWMGHRTPEAAARELLAAAAQAAASRRLLAVAVTTDLGAAAEPAWRDSLGELSLRGYAKGALAALAGQEVPDDLVLEDVAWIATDTLLALTDLDPGTEHDRAELARLLDETVPRGQEQRMFEAMARLPHREVAGLLTMLGREHPDKKTAKLARKAAYKAGTRQAAISSR